VNIIEMLRADVEHVIEHHGAEIQEALDTAAKVAGSPAAQIVLGLAHCPPTSVEAFAAMLQKVDADFGKLTPPASEPEPQPVIPASAGTDGTTPDEAEMPGLDVPAEHADEPAA
jgi:hypothetical protein